MYMIWLAPVVPFSSTNSLIYRQSRPRTQSRERWCFLREATTTTPTKNCQVPQKNHPQGKRAEISVVS
jgi:hypothetical protein